MTSCWARWLAGCGHTSATSPGWKQSIFPRRSLKALGQLDPSHHAPDRWGLHPGLSPLWGCGLGQGLCSPTPARATWGLTRVTPPHGPLEIRSHFPRASRGAQPCMSVSSHVCVYACLCLCVSSRVCVCLCLCVCRRSA